MPQPEATFAVHTVAVYLPGTDTRVLVDQLGGPPAEAIADARRLVQVLAGVPPARWAAKVVATDVITDVMPPDSDKEISA